MIFKHLFFVVIVFGCVNNQMSAMWHLPDWDDDVDIVTENTEYQLPSWDNDPNILAEGADFLKKQNFVEFFKTVNFWRINPNRFTTPAKSFPGGYLGKVAKSKDLTAIIVACYADPTGEVVKRLLVYDGIDMSVKIDGVWEPLWLALKLKNWRSVDAFIACEELELSDTDVEYACSILADVEILRFAKSVYTAMAEKLMGKKATKKNH